MMSILDMRRRTKTIATILSVVLVVFVISARPTYAQKQINAAEFPVASYVTRDEIISMLELQYQTMLDLPFTPMTETSLSALDMAISNVSSASVEELQVFQAAGVSTRALMSNVQKLAEIIAEKNPNSDTSKNWSWR